jgi:hypothetical protein
MKQPNLDDLTPYHRKKVLDKARAWRLENHKLILSMLKGHHTPHMPQGSGMFDPTKWTAANWIWFREFLMEELTRRKL